MKCDRTFSVTMSTEELELLERTAEQSATSRNDLIRRCINHGLNALLINGLFAPNVDRMLREARSPLLSPHTVPDLLTGRCGR
jgi:hypothetical protein